MTQDREQALKEYDYMVSLNKENRDIDSISRLGFWAKDNEAVIRKALEAKEPEVVSKQKIKDMYLHYLSDYPEPRSVHEFWDYIERRYPNGIKLKDGE